MVDVVVVVVGVELLCLLRPTLLQYLVPIYLVFKIIIVVKGDLLSRLN